MQTLQQLFVHELQDAFAAEQRLLQSLQQMTQCGTNQQLQRAFRAHVSETQAHLDRLQQVFAGLGFQPGTEPCAGMDGIVQEHQQFLQQHTPTAQIHTVFDVGAAERAEHYEIATYQELVRLANLLGMTQAAQLFEATLSDEREQLSRLQNVASEMGQQLARPAAQFGTTGQQGQTPTQGRAATGGQSQLPAQ